MPFCFSNGMGGLKKNVLIPLFEVWKNRLYICFKVRSCDMFKLHKLIKIPSEAPLQNQASSFLVKDLVPFSGCRITVEGCDEGAAQILLYRRFVTLQGSDLI